MHIEACTLHDWVVAGKHTSHMLTHTSRCKHMQITHACTPKHAVAASAVVLLPLKAAHERGHPLKISQHMLNSAGLDNSLKSTV
jgi:hypothetical protein